MWPFNRRESAQETEKALESISTGSWARIFDWTPNAWQTNHAYTATESSALQNPVVFACITLIQGDIGKMPFCVEQEVDGVWQSVNHDVLKLLRRPNLYQNQIQFLKNWVLSKLLFGNTYVLKIRQGREITGLVILDPLKVTPLISESGEVFYQITDDRLTMVEGTKILPSTEIIHDRDNCLHDPLVGLSPLYAGLSAAQIGNTIIKDAKGFFNNGAKPGGILAAPGAIADDTAKRLKDYWEANFSGDSSGKIAVVGDGLTYEPMRMNSVDAQLIDQLGWSDEKICSVFHVPAYMVGVGQAPTYNNIEALTIQYYSQCLQDLVCSLEECLNLGLNIQGRFRIKLDVESLFRMDKSSMADFVNKLVAGKIMTPDEGRAKFGLSGTAGGDTLWGQKQDYPLGVLSERHAEGLMETPAPVEAPEEPGEPEEPEDQEMNLDPIIIKGLLTEYREAATSDA